MRIKYYLAIVILGSLGLGYAMEALLSSYHKHDQMMIEIDNNYNLATRDIDRLSNDVTQLLISADLILGSDQNYLIPSTLKKGILTLKKITDDQKGFLGEKYSDYLNKIHSSIEGINENIKQSKSINSNNREEDLYRILIKNDEQAGELLNLIKEISDKADLDQSKHKKDLRENIKSSDNLSLLVRFFYGLIVFFMWIWVNNHICTPISLLSRRATDIEDQDSISLNKKGPKEIQQLSLQLEESASKLLFQARHDPLTGLYNRREFARQLTKVFRSEETTKHHPPTLCFIDLDRFKAVNDSCGHAAGDELLIIVAKEITKNAGEGSIIARMGGDEFAVLITDTPDRQCLAIVNEILDSIRNIRFERQGATYHISASIGITFINDTDVNVNEWLNAADSACFSAKHKGRDTIQTFRLNDDRLVSIRSETNTYNQILKALDEDRFVLYHQEIASIQRKNKKPRHYEILLRMISEEGKIIPPQSFLEVAERFDLAEQIDQWVVEKTILWMQNNHKEIRSLHTCSINLSGKSLASEKMHTFLIEKIKSIQHLSKKICFEITETAAVNDMEAAKRLIKDLRALGCRFALDDFGTGQSSFAYLKTLKVDIIKIDGTFIRDIHSNTFDQVMVKSMNDLAKSVNMKTVAEYVEDESTAKMLLNIGVDYGQGFFFHKPEPLEKNIESSPTNNTQINHIIDRRLYE